MKIFLDDLRQEPIGWIKFINYETLISFLNEYKETIEEISLDHDLGEDKTGYDVCKWFVENDYWIPIINIHSANNVGVKNMYQLLDRYAPPEIKIKIKSSLK